jgi:DNA-binding transcriptional regulator YdaS (Cro superfamily)
MKVAKRLGVAEPVLGAWMRGETPMPTINLLILATMLDEQAEGAGRRGQGS